MSLNELSADPVFSKTVFLQPMASINFPNTDDSPKILIIGDVMLDTYLQGTVSRISPEAPVQVVHHTMTHSHLGGAANVARNIMSLGATPVLLTMVGMDEPGQQVVNLLEREEMTREGVLCVSDRPTTVKTRIMSGRQQLLRIDQEVAKDVTSETEDRLIESFRKIMDAHPIRVIVIQDYNKGLLTDRLIRYIIGSATVKHVPVCVDPKFHHFFDYKHVTIFKPNLKELSEGLGIQIIPDEPGLLMASRMLHQRIQNRYSLITLGEKGMWWYDHDLNTGGLVPAKVRDIIDVCGAGDTVIATAAVGLAMEWEIATIAMAANMAGGQVCEKSGVVPVSRSLLKAEIGQFLS